MRTLLSWLPQRKDRIHKKARTATKRSRLRFEPLEDRWLPTTLTLALNPTSISEAAGPAAAIGTVTRSNTALDQPLAVNLSSSDSTEATVPASVTIAAGQASATFAIDAVDDNLADGTQTVTITASASGASAVGLDATFGINGYRPINQQVSWSSNFPDVKLQADGKILAAADSLTSGAAWGLTRLLANGTPDTTFGSSGSVTTSFPGANDGQANGIAVQSDGKIVVVGIVTGATNNNGDWGIARYLPTGALDTTFGSGGTARFNFNTGFGTPAGGWAYDVTIQGDGKILVAGTNFTSQATGFTVIRLNTNGTLDNTFGVSGVASIDLDATHYETAYAMQLQADGKIVLVGTVSGVGFGVARLNANGTPDTTFASGGKRVIAATAFGSTYTNGGSAQGVALQSDGKIVVGGYVDDASYRGDWAAARLNTDGSLDTSFSGDGLVAFDFTGLDDQALDVAIQTDGKIVLAGAAFMSPNGTDSALARLNPDGSLDTSFDGDGKYTAPPLAITWERIWAIDLTSDGNAVGLVAYSNDTRVGRFSLGSGSVTASATLQVTDNEVQPVAQPDSYTTDENTSLTVDAPGVLANDSGGPNAQLVAILNSAPTHGSLVLNLDGSFTYTPDAGFSGPDTFAYRASDGTLQSNLAFVTIAVNRINEGPPTANDDAYSVDEDGTLTIVNLPPVTGAGETSLTMTSQAGDYIGQGRTYNYNTSTGTFNVYGTSTGDIEIAYSDAVHWWYLDFDAPFNDPLQPGTYLNAQRAAFHAPDHPGLDVSGDGRGSNTLTGQFTVKQALYDASGHVIRFDATFEQHSEGATPALFGEIKYNYWSGPLIPNGVLVNDTDPDGDPLTAVLVSGPSNGTLSLNSDGTFTYHPSANFNGVDSFTYKAFDGVAYSDPATVTITVNPVNDAPVAVADSYSLDEDTPLSVPAPGVLANDTDVDGDALTAQLYSAPSHGTLTLNADGSFTYTPAANYNGSDSFQYRAFDGQLYSAPVTVTLTIRAVNDAPLANPDSYTTDEDTTLTIAGIIPTTGAGQTMLHMVSDPGDYIGQGRTYDYNPSTGAFSASRNYDNGVSLSYNEPAYNGHWWYLDFAGPTNGTLLPGTYLNAQRFPFQDPGHPGLDVSGDGRGSNTLTGQFTVTQAVYGTDGHVIRFGATFEQHSEGATPALRGEVRYNYWAAPLVPGVLANDTDVEGDALQFILVSGPSHGTLSVNADGTIVYTPDTNFNGVDTFGYKVSDGQLESAPTTVTINVRPVNDAPVAAADTYTLDENTTLSVPAAGVLANDTDVDGDPLTAALVSGPAHGSLTLNADGSFTYMPDAHFSGTDSFTYKANDGALDSNVVSVTLNVQFVNSAPLANPDAYVVDEDNTLSVPAAGVLANDTDADGDPLTATLVSGPAHGALTFNGAGSFTYTPDANFNGTDSFTYQVSDGIASSNTTMVSITVSPVDDAPVAAPDAYALDEDATLTVPGTGVLANDTDVEGDTLSAVLLSGPSHGTLALNADGSFTYTPDANFNGTDSFTYQASDGQLVSLPVSVTLTVNPVQDPPVANAGPDQTAGETQSVSFNGSGSSDVDGDALTFAWDFGDGSTATGVAPSHAYADNGTYTVTLTVTDGYGNSASDTAIVTVTNVAPTAALSGPASGVRGQDRGFTFSATDPSAVDTAAGFTYSVNWGDGTSSTIAGPGSGVQLAHTWVAAGSYTVRVTATDKDGGAGSATQGIAVKVVELQNGNLVVGGTNAGERITIKPADRNGGLQVQFNGASQGVFTPTGDVIVYGQAGDDTIELLTAKINGRTTSVTRPAYVFGGDGNDTLNATGTTAGAVLVGGNGADTMTGGSGRDVLIGGIGIDRLTGNGDEDILIGSSTIYDGNLDALRAIRAEWSRTDVTAATRKAHLNGTLPGGLNGLIVLNGTSVIDDGVTDTFTSDSSDWIFQ
jgi:large repetitive protein